MTTFTDRFGRQHTYARISITDRCNLACKYCMPDGGMIYESRDALLTFEEIERLVRILVRNGVTKIRLTGGEPLVRHDAPDLVRRLGAVEGLRTLAMSTNALLLAPHAAQLHGYGLSRINISLDTLRAERFTRITGSTKHAAVLAGIEAAHAAGFERIKINVVVMRNVNDDELGDFARFAAARDLHIRFIEYMPFLGNGWNEAACMPYADMRRAVEAAVDIAPVAADDGPNATAKEFAIGGSRGTVGFITTMTDDFCAGCNRLRITSEGKFRNCLFATGEMDIRALMRGGASDDAIADAIRAGLATKWERHPGAHELQEQERRAMIAIGG